MNYSVFQFFCKTVRHDDIYRKHILEVGSLNMNGSVKELTRCMWIEEYIGIDMQRGLGVDIILRAEEMLDRFGPDRFDVVFSTEMLEHALEWRIVINNMKTVLKPRGMLFLTTRSKGMPFHGYPDDFWRFELEDMAKIFSDFTIESMESDYEEPGIFIKAFKPMVWTPTDLSQIDVYRVTKGID